MRTYGGRQYSHFKQAPAWDSPLESTPVESPNRSATSKSGEKLYPPAWRPPPPFTEPRAFWAFIEFTPFGRFLLAGSRDPERVGLLGVNLPIELSSVFGVGCLLAGLAGMLAGPMWTVQPATVCL